MHEENPLANMQLDEDPVDLEYYGYGPQGPSPLEDNGQVVVPEIHSQKRHRLAASCGLYRLAASCHEVAASLLTSSSCSKSVRIRLAAT